MPPEAGSVLCHRARKCLNGLLEREEAESADGFDLKSSCVGVSCDPFRIGNTGKGNILSSSVMPKVILSPTSIVKKSLYLHGLRVGTTYRIAHPTV